MHCNSNKKKINIGGTKGGGLDYGHRYTLKPDIKLVNNVTDSTPSLYVTDSDKLKDNITTKGRLYNGYCVR